MPTLHFIILLLVSSDSAFASLTDQLIQRHISNVLFEKKMRALAAVEYLILQLLQASFMQPETPVVISINAEFSTDLLTWQ